jgi:dTDP-4-amino-4,6-dideoxygalactose transaminase
MLTSFFTQYASTHSWPALRGIKSDMPLQKFPMFVDDAQGKRATLKKKNIHLDDGWTGCVICPDSVDMDSTSYRWGEDPVAEAACMQIFSLPTHPTMTLFEAQRLARAVDEVCKK